MPVSVANLLTKIPATWRRILGVRFDKSPIQTVDKLLDFVQTRAAYVAQTSLYGYLKTRMGTRFRQVFEDDAFLPSINHAKWRTYGACLSDLAVFAAAISGAENRLDTGEIARLAQYCFTTAVDQTFDDADAAKVRDATLASFEDRITRVHWANAAIKENAFSVSPEELIESAPIADELKAEDRDIVMNSIRFRWRDIREQLRKRIDPDAICRDWHDMQP